MNSIDFFRGLTMFLLMGESTRLYSQFALFDNKFMQFIGTQLSHHEWHGLHFWDLIQPFFMFIVGVAMPFSLSKRLARGDSWGKAFYHALTRSFWLLVLGFMLGAGDKSFDLTNVLAQLSFTYIIAFLLMQKAIKWQLLVSFAMILLSDLLYRLWPVE
ncbi:MAG TPA: DUF5009 domain-containing protein, partial [Ignavibacteria bacterium]